MASDPLLLATRSRPKAREIRQILGAGARSQELLTLDDAGLPPAPDEDAIEAFDTFTANAIAKARYFAIRSGLATLADDSGLRVDALGGKPGVFSKRFAARPDLDGDALDRANIQALFQALRESASPDRAAHYVCAAALVRPGRAPLLTLASSSGALIDRPRGTHGFGYDPVFLVPSLGLTFAELELDDKNRLSHRGHAFRALASLLAWFPLDSADLLPAAPTRARALDPLSAQD